MAVVKISLAVCLACPRHSCWHFDGTDGKDGITEEWVCHTHTSLKAHSISKMHGPRSRRKLGPVPADCDRQLEHILNATFIKQHIKGEKCTVQHHRPRRLSAVGLKSLQQHLVTSQYSTCV